MVLGSSAAPSTEVVTPGIRVGIVGLPLGTSTLAKLLRTVVDTHLHLPDMFELTFNDEAGDVVDDAGLSIGTIVAVYGTKAGDQDNTLLIKGEVTSIEAICLDGQIRSVVRGYEKAHRLQRARRTKTYVNMKDSDIARKVARDAGLTIGTIDTSNTTHTHIAQIAQTDWDFLTERAREIGFETGVTQGKFFFRKASGQPAGGALGAVAGAVAGALGLGSALTFKQNLFTFLPRISAANITPDVEVRVWDPKTARVVVGKNDAETGTAKISGEDPKALANTFTGGLLPIPSLPSLPQIPGLPKLDFGSAPSNTAFVVTNRPLAVGSAADGAADEMAKGLADHIASTFAEAEGDAQGDPSIQAGEQVDIKGVPKQFVGKWTVTNARHIFDPQDGGYHTRFWVSGRQNRSLFELASGGAPRERNPALVGLVCGVVTNVQDPDKKGKVKVALPWLSPGYESDWARVVHLSAGARTGAMFVPEVGDEVLVGFEFGDARRPYVLGGLINDNAKFSTMDGAVTGSAVTGRGFASPAGNQLLFTDDLPPGPAGAAPPNKSSIVLGTGDGNLGLEIDQVAGTVTLTCKPAPPKSKSAAGTVTIDCSGAGKIEIKAGAGGMKIDSEGQLELNGKLGVKIASNAIVEVQGQMVKLN
jgi:phage protein D